MRKAQGAKRGILASILEAGGMRRREDIERDGLGESRALTNCEANGWVTGGGLRVSITDAGKQAL